MNTLSRSTLARNTLKTLVVVGATMLSASAFAQQGGNGGNGGGRGGSGPSGAEAGGNGNEVLSFFNENHSPTHVRRRPSPNDNCRTRDCGKIVYVRSACSGQQMPPMVDSYGRITEFRCDLPYRRN